ncbi:hypothetical protein C8J56DRAFT_85569 [Mycena floridula]|nr:hypothetical protein C8J56DRAFT_85569 [Mycena floridula]
MSPMRKDTSSEEKKRDVLTERLARVAQNSSPISPPVTQTASSASSPAMKSAERPRIKSVDYNMADLAELLGDNIRLISRNGEEAQVDSDSDEDEEEEDDESEPPSPTRIAPIPIKQRTPAPSFSVTSRPRNQFTESGRPLSSSPTASPTKTVVSPRPRSTTLLTSPPASAAPRNPPKSSTMQPEVSPKTSPASALSIPPRQRSTTMVTRTSETQAIYQPMKPFATPRDSPASSTGDSSSGRAPFTPRDGSDIGSGSSGRKDEEDKWSGGATGLLSPGKHNKRRSVSFEQDAPLVTGKPKPDDESRRRDRRRNEAKAAIELGNVINGRGPIVDDDDDDQPINQAYAGRMNPLMPQMTGPMSMPMGFNPQAGWNGMNMSPWPQMPQMPQMQNQMLTPNHMMPPPADPNFLVAHQQAMMYAKQAYQMAVAQHAMAAAADEWERGSTMSFSGGGGSVYGGPASALPMMGSMNSPPFMGMGGNGWSTGSMIFPNTARSAYGGGGARSEYGGGGGGGNGNGNWSSSRSVYGETFGDHKPSRPSPPAQQSGYFPPTPVQSSSSDPRANARNRTFSSPNPNRTTPPVRKAPPPSSWKVNGA